jgi:hypothetical protein
MLILLIENNMENEYVSLFPHQNPIGTGCIVINYLLVLAIYIKAR